VATPGRTEDPDVTDVTACPQVDLERWPIAEMLDREPYRFEFFQAVRLLERMRPERQVVGRFTNPGEEAVRFGANPGVAFPASQIQSLERRPDGSVFLMVNFMGLTGPMGVLPMVYSQLVLERLRARDTTMRDFFDLFNHRMVSLFSQAWEKYRFAVPYERGERDRFSGRVLALIGLGTPGLEGRLDVPDDSLLFYSGLLSSHARSAEGLRAVLIDFFGVGVEIDQFVGAWYPLERSAQCVLDGGREEEKLGWGTVVGDEVWDQQSKIRIRLGPLTLDQYRGFLPGGEAWRELNSLTEFYAGGEYGVEVQLILRRDHVPSCELNAAAEVVPQLGWTSWVKSAPFFRDAGETILDLTDAK
jgi:type VI secretion system protein ImpH